MGLENEWFKLVAVCPACETPYQTTDARLLAEDKDVKLVHATCQACAQAFLSLVLAGKVGAGCIGLATDLSAEDVLRFRQAKNLTIDDVIDTHAFVEGTAWKTLAVRARKTRVRARAS